MRNKVLLILLLCTSLSAFAQHPKGITGVIEIKTESQLNELIKENKSESWMHLKYEKDSDTYIMMFNLTPVGLKHAIETTTNLLNENDLSFSNPYEDKSLLPSWAESIYEYSDVNLGVKSGNAEISLIWHAGKELQISLINSGRSGYFIIVMSANNTTVPDTSSPTAASKTIKDYDGNVYNSVSIGTQIWMVENLKTTKYNDGSPIPHPTSSDINTPAYYWYSDNKTNKNIYGALYNWYAVNTKKLCPNGWHVPSINDWSTLLAYLGVSNVAGGKLKENGTEHWNSPNASATNETGFTALPGGFRFSSGFYLTIGDQGHWWSSSEYNDDSASSFYLSSSNGEINTIIDFDKRAGVSVRCIKD